ncbi:HNH endonuclease [Streptomyces phage Marky]|nr:HNH endonuclease [Streptomyces phage Marky]
MNVMQRFNAKWRKDPVTGCHVWTKGRKEKGYAQFWDGRNVRAHRWLYQRAHKLTDEQMPELLMHICDNPPCVNERHLMPGTHEENMADRREKQREARGLRNGAARLSDEIVSEIRKLGARGGFTQKAIGQKLGVSRAHVGSILRGEYRV